MSRPLAPKRVVAACPTPGSSRGGVGWTRGRRSLPVLPLVPLSILLFAADVEAQNLESRADAPARFNVVESSIPEMQAAMAAGRTNSRELVSEYLRRLSLYDPILHAAIAVNPAAVEEAEALDRERAAGRVRSPLHGVPIALKDNIQTAGMPTTGGALAFRGWLAPYEATLARNLRDAGAVIIAKTGMTELANWIAAGMPGNYNSMTGFGLNPYDPRADPRERDGRPVLPTGGSSSGIGTAASLWAANVGTETDGSILSPATQTMLVGIKPTVGRVSRYGVIPITADQDTPGPMARTVTDAALLLGAMEGDGPDPKDVATGICERPEAGDYTRFLDANSLRGARIGIPRAYFYERVRPPGVRDYRGGLSPDQSMVMEEAIAALRAAGAVIIDPVEIPSIIASDPAENFLLWPVCAAPSHVRGRDGGCSIVLKYGMKRDFETWLRSLGEAAPVSSIEELRAWNHAHAGEGAIRFGQSRLDISDEVDLELDRARYEADRAKDLRLAKERGIDFVFEQHRLDALVFPGASGSSIAARAGYPSVTVPFGMVALPAVPPLPRGFVSRPMPMGVTFTGRACSEPQLVAMAYAFEQATRRRASPSDFP